MSWVRAFADELLLSIPNASIWLSVGEAILFGGAALLIGVWVARTVGALRSDAPAGETFGVGVATGLLVLASWWSAIASGGRSSFTPLAVSLAIAIALALVRRTRTSYPAHAGASRSMADRRQTTNWTSLRPLSVAVVASAVFIAAVALLYGSTMALSPRAGVQPLEFMDEAFYSILGRDLSVTGAETFFAPSGFDVLGGLPSQTWYHWGELWLAAANIRIFGADPIAARYFIVLPLLLLAAGSLTGTLVRRLTGTSSRGPFLFGFFACLFLAPMPWLSGPFFSNWAVGLIFGITMYGLGAVAVLLAMYGGMLLFKGAASWPLVGFVGSVVAMIAPAHLILGVLAAVGIVGVCAVRGGRELIATRRMPTVPTVWMRFFAWTGITVAVTFTWGLLTGHGIGASGLSASVAPFNTAWLTSIAATVVLGGAFVAIAVAWFADRRSATYVAGIYLGTLILLVVGAIAWGARLGDHNMFHAYFAGIAVFATPAAAVACWTVWIRLRGAGRPLVALLVILLCIAQVEFGAGLGVMRLQRFGPGNYEPVPLELLDAIRRLPADAKIAYACQPSEELAFWEARLLAIGAHTTRRIVPMCFQAESLGRLNEISMSNDVMSPLFAFAPQRTLYPTAMSRPSPERVTEFLKAHAIDYIYADTAHPNTLVPIARIIARSGAFQLLEVR